MSTSPRSKKHQLILIFSVALFVFAVVSMAFQVCSLIVGGRYSQISTGIWCGILYIATGITGLVSIRGTNSSKLSWALCSSAIGSSIGSIALIALSALGLGDNLQGSQESVLLLWTVSNAFLIAIGIMALVASVTVAVVAPYKPKEESAEIEVEVKESIESDYITIPKYPPSDVVAIVKPNSNGDLYEILESPRPSTFNKDSEEYVLPYKSDKKSLNSEDFEIQVDNEYQDKLAQKKRVIYNDWLTSPVLPADNSKRSDSETQEEEGWKTILVPKEDILIHAPSSPNQREHSLNNDIPHKR